MMLAKAEHEAAVARKAFTALEDQAILARELGENLPPAFWEVFGKAHISVTLAERGVNLARERLRRA